jgi:hypothetical protein
VSGKRLAFEHGEFRLKLVVARSNTSVKVSL